MTTSPARRSSKVRVHDIIFQHDSPAERAFDGTLTAAILLSVLIVVLDSVPSVAAQYGNALRIAEWTFTILFSVEYVLRLATVQRPLKYAVSFFGIVDLAAVAPTYLSVLLPGAQTLLVIRALRLLRVFRVLKLGEYVGEAHLLTTALRASRRKITVFFTTVLTIVLIVGALMHLIEGEEHGFSNIPISIYWAIVTMTTVGYGDIAPHTVLGQFVASALMIAGYAIIAVPTGIVTAEISQATRRGANWQSCPGCGSEGHDADALHCK